MNVLSLSPFRQSHQLLYWKTILIGREERIMIGFKIKLILILTLIRRTTIRCSLVG